MNTPTTVNVIDGHKTADDLSEVAIEHCTAVCRQRTRPTTADHPRLRQRRWRQRSAHREPWCEWWWWRWWEGRYGGGGAGQERRKWLWLGQGPGVETVVQVVQVTKESQGEARHHITAVVFYVTDRQTDRQCPLDTVADWMVSPVLICCEFVINNEHWCGCAVWLILLRPICVSVCLSHKKHIYYVWWDALTHSSVLLQYYMQSFYFLNVNQKPCFCWKLPILEPWMGSYHCNCVWCLFTLRLLYYGDSLWVRIIALLACAHSFFYFQLALFPNLAVCRKSQWQGAVVLSLMSQWDGEFVSRRSGCRHPCIRFLWCADWHYAACW